MLLGGRSRPKAFIETSMQERCQPPHLHSAHTRFLIFRRKIKKNINAREVARATALAFSYPYLFLRPLPLPPLAQ